MLDRVVIVNSTPIIALSAIDRLHLLKDIYNIVYIPKAVNDEIFVKQNSKAQNDLVKAREWIQVKQIENVESRRFSKVQLHDGEVEVMILGKELGADLLIIAISLVSFALKITPNVPVILKSKYSAYFLAR